MLRRDPAWDGPLEQAVSPRNDETRRLLTLYLQSEFGDRPDLLAQVRAGLPGRRQAGRARQRHLGPHPSSGPTWSSSQPASTASSPEECAAPTDASTKPT